MPTESKTLGLRELINRIKQDLLSEQLQSEPALFSIDEVTLELNFTITGDIDSGFDLGVVSLGSQVSEERIQKVTIKMTPLISREQLVKNLNSGQFKVTEDIETATRAMAGFHEGPIVYLPKETDG